MPPVNLSPEYADVLGPLTALFARAAQAGPTGEVEVKLGKLDDDGFTSGVTQDWYNAQLLKLEGYEHWDGVEDWTDTADYYFPESVRATQDAEGNTRFERKTLVEQCDVAVARRPLDLRFSWKDETPIKPEVGHPEWVRIKKRKRFIFHGFSHDFSYVWSGRSDAEAKAAPPNYEIEIECLNLQHEFGPEYLALSMLMKAHDLLERDAPIEFSILGAQV